MSNEDWKKFMDAIPTNKVSPFGSYEEYLTREGVTKEDKENWDSLGEVKHQKIKEENESSIIRILWMMTENDKLSPEEAHKKLYKQMVVFDDYPYTPQRIHELNKLGFTSEDDYPLPWELQARVERYSEKLFKDTKWFQETQKLVSSTTSSNAAIRTLVREGIV